MKIIAHRGNNIEKVENKIDGILKTLSYPYIDGVEIDVHMTKDGVLILEHNLLIHTDSRQIKNIAKEKYKNLKKLCFIKKEKKYKLETLHSFFKKVHTKKIIMIECKEEYGRNKMFIKALLKEIKHKKNIIVCSFSYDLLRLFQKYSSIPTGLLVGYLLNLNKDYHSFSYLLLSVSNITSNKKNNPYYVWTLHHKEELAKIPKSNKFVGIITDKGYIFQK